MSTVTLNDAYFFCEPIYNAPGETGAKARQEYDNWVALKNDMSRVPAIIKEIADAAGCGVIHAAHLVDAIATGDVEEIIKTAEITVTDLPVYRFLKEFYNDKLHAKDSSGQAWSGALYGRKVRGKDEYKAGLADKIGEYPALIAFYCLNNGLCGIQKIRAMAGIAWAQLKEWILAAIQHINKFRKDYMPRVLAMGTLRAKDFCLGIFARNKTIQGQTKNENETIDDGNDASFETEFDDDGGDDNDDNKKRGRGEKTQRGVTAKIVYDTIKSYDHVRPVTASAQRMKEAIQKITPSMLISALQTPEKVSDFFGLLWQWAEIRETENMTREMILQGPEQAIPRLVHGIKNGYLPRPVNEDPYQSEIPKIWIDVRNDAERKIYLTRPETRASTKQMHAKHESDHFISVLVNPDQDLIEYFAREAVSVFKEETPSAKETRAREKKRDKISRTGRFLIRRAHGLETITCQIEVRPRHATPVTQGDGDDSNDKHGAPMPMWDMAGVEDWRHDCLAKSKLDEWKEEIQERQAAKKVRAQDTPITRSSFRNACQGLGIDADTARRAELAGPCSMRALLDQYRPRQSKPVLMAKPLGVTEYKDLSKVIGLPATVIQDALAGDTDKFGTLTRAIDRLPHGQRVTAEEQIKAMIAPRL